MSYIKLYSVTKAYELRNTLETQTYLSNEESDARKINHTSKNFRN